MSMQSNDTQRLYYYLTCRRGSAHLVSNVLYLKKETIQLCVMLLEWLHRLQGRLVTNNKCIKDDLQNVLLFSAKYGRGDMRWTFKIKSKFSGFKRNVPVNHTQVFSFPHWNTMQPIGNTHLCCENKRHNNGDWSLKKRSSKTLHSWCRTFMGRQQSTRQVGS